MSLSRGSFSDRIPIFFFVSPKMGVFFKGRKNSDQKTNQKSATASSRPAHSPQKPPFRRRQTRASNAEMYREYIGARFDAAASVARRSRGPFTSGVCVRKTKVERDLQSFFHRERSIAHTNRRTIDVMMGKKRGEELKEILFLVRFY